MAKPIRFKPTKTANGWKVNVPAKVSESGIRERHFFRTFELAKAAGDKLKEKREEFGTQSKAIRPSLSEAATLAESILAPWNVSLVDAARIVAGIRERETASRPLADAADDWLIACEGLRDRTVASYKQSARRLKAALGHRQLASISTGELQAALAPPGATGAAMRCNLRNAKALWRWAATQGWCQAGTFAVEAPKGGRESEIEFLTVEEATALLRAAEANYPQAVASYALQLFAGIRAEEVTRLESQHVSTDGIDLPASVTKKGRRRHILPCPTLKAWLEAHPFEPCPNWPRIDRACRRLAGWELEAALLTDPPAPHRGPWPQNALRHSHASYSVALGTPLEALLFEFGHAGTPALLRAHYVGRASKKQAIAFFQIAPDGVEIPALAIA